MSRWRMAMTAPLLLAAFFAISVAVVQSANAPQTLDEQVHSVASTLRCPVCLNLSVADSPSPVAQEMRNQIRRQLESGMTPDQVRAQFVASYGEWIMLSPPKRGLTLTAWVIPPLLLLIGAIIAGLTIRRWTSKATPLPGHAPPLTDGDRQLLDGELAHLPESEIAR